MALKLTDMEIEKACSQPANHKTVPWTVQRAS